MESYHYTYWGRKKAVVVQFSRGCPYPCSYCGQSLFWQRWRHRDPQQFADEIEMLHNKYQIELFNFADENPATNQKAWKAFLEALIKKNLNITLVGSIRADNVVRDAEYLHLYKQAGFERFLLGIENYDSTILEKIKKEGSMNKDKEAIQLLRKNNILSMATYVIGFGEETFKDLLNSFKQLLDYDPDQIQLLYVTPHKWTPYFEEVKHKNIIQLDQQKWDYKHQILEMKHLRSWQLLICVKLIEVCIQMRPKALKRLFFHKDVKLRAAMRWYTNIGRRVWFHELFEFFFNRKRQSSNITLDTFWK
jgi:anaerobic magnesium-protoporphyrin IX monomethyl ester cyclase